MLHMIILSTSYPFETPEICFLAPGIWTTSALEGTLCFPPWALKLNLPKVVRHWAWEKTSDSQATMRCRAQEHQKSESSKSMAISDFILMYAFRKQPLSTSTAMKVQNDCPCFTDFTALEGSTPKKIPSKKATKSHLREKEHHLQKVPFWGEKTLVPRRVTTLRFSAWNCHLMWSRIGRLRLVWPNQPALKHAGDKAGRWLRMVQAIFFG